MLLLLLLLLTLLIININSFISNPKFNSNMIKLPLKDENIDDFDETFDKRVIQTKLTKRFNDRFPGTSDNENKFSRSSSSSPSNDLVEGVSRWEVLNRALIAGVFVAGIGAGVTIDSAINTNPKDLASRDAIDRNAPNPELCAAFGSSAMVMDERIFLTFNPFNVYVTQADTKPGCVLRPSNVVSQLQKERTLLSDDEVNSCKNGFNTWAFVGDINNKPQLNCVFQSDDAQNEFLSDPKKGLGEDVYDDDSGRNSGRGISGNGVKFFNKNNNKNYNLTPAEADKANKLLERSLRRQSTAGPQK